jgi:hypothetical protein
MRKLLMIMMLVPMMAFTQTDTTNDWCKTHEKFNEAMKTNMQFVLNMDKMNHPLEVADWGEKIIPVVVHIIYSDSSQILSEEDIRAQIKGLDADFNGENWDVGNTPDAFKESVADFKLRFKIATVDPEGNPTTGITYTKTDNSYFSMMKEDAKFDALGGKDAWNSGQYLNVWVCQLEWGLRGYAQFPGDLMVTDGVVLGYGSFGIEDTVIDNNEKHAQYYRVLTHEVGHWVGLFHIWGDSYCGNDRVKDTPQQTGPHRWCYADEGIATCGSDDLPVNYMDYVQADCMVMFTDGQRKRAMKAMRLFRRSIVKNGRKLTK